MRSYTSLVMAMLVGVAVASEPDRFDRTKFHIGTWRYKDYLHDEVHVKELAECGIDYVCMDKGWDNRELLDLFQKYGVGVMASGPVPRWGIWLEHGGWAKTNPLSDYEKAATTFVDHPALWGVNILDETNALDFPHGGDIVARMRKLFPRQICYFDINPNYAHTASNETWQAKVASDYGTATYEGYIDEYCRAFPSDFISYDFFIYSRDRPRGAQQCWDNYRVVADACRSTGRSFWYAPQVNSRYGDKWTTENQLRFQAYSSMAFGAEAIAWCCWSAGWWTNQVVDAKGQRTQQYDKLKRMNAELQRLGPDFMRYRNTATHFIGFKGTPWLEQTKCRTIDALWTGYFQDVRAEDNGPLVVGEMVARAGADKGRALFVFAADDPYDVKPMDRRVVFRVPEAAITVFAPTGRLSVAPSSDGIYSLPIRSNSCLLITRD